MSNVEIWCTEDACRIRERMQTIRGRMDREVRGIRSNADSLLDWKSRFRSHPIISLGTAFAVGMVLGPRRRVTPTLDLSEDSIQQLLERGRVTVVQQERATSSMLKSAATLGINMLLRSGIAYLGQQLGKQVGVAASEATSDQHMES